MEQENKKTTLDEVADPMHKAVLKKIEGAPVITESMIKENHPANFPKIMLDSSFWLLLVSNVFAIYLINKNNVELSGIMLIYWMQSVMIGVFNFVRILSLKDFSTKNFGSNNKELPPTTGTKFLTAGFFAVHFGMFHLVYFGFIFSTAKQSFIDWIGILSIALIFFFNHLFSFIRNFKQETEKQNIGLVMFSPYVRIIPMHLTILFGYASPAISVNLFLFLKTSVDLLSHIYKHKVSIEKQV